MTLDSAPGAMVDWWQHTARRGGEENSVAEIIRTYREELPRARFVGRRYTESDRVNGSFAAHWGTWFGNGWFDVIEKANPGRLLDGSYVGLMLGDEGMDCSYWIGILCAEGAAVPEGFAAVDLPAAAAAVCWIRGPEGPALYGMHDACVRAMREAGMADWYRLPDGSLIFFERYSCPRFTTPDEQGRVILDYGAYLA